MHIKTTSLKTKPFSNNLILIFLLFFIISLIVYGNLLQYGLASDEYRGLYMVKSAFTPFSYKSFKVFISPYGGQFALVSLLSLIFGYKPMPFYFTGVLLRVLTSLSVYALTVKVFKSKIAGFPAGLYTLLAYGGVQSTWPINANVYASLILLIWGLSIWIDIFRKPEKNNLFKSLMAYLIYAVSFVICPVRMHGVILLVILTELLVFLFLKKKLKYSFFRISFFFFGLYLMKKIGFLDSYGTAAGVTQTLLNPRYFAALENPIGTIIFPLLTYSRLIIPVDLISFLNNLYLQINNTAIIYALASLAIIPLIISVKDKIKTLVIIPLVAYTLLILTTEKYVPDNFVAGKYFSDKLHLIITSIIVPILISRLLITFIRKNKVLLAILIVFFLWPLIFILVPYLSWPFFKQGTESRYFTPSVIGISFIFGYFSSLIRKKSLSFKILSISMFFLAILSNIKYARQYIINGGEGGIYQRYINESFLIMNSEIGDRRNKNRPIVFIKDDETKFSYLAITEGGQERFSLLNDNLSENAQPFFVSSMDVLKDIYAGRAAPITTDIESFYGFEIKNKKVYSITDKIRSELTN